jgi:hypothetical protein
VVGLVCVSCLAANGTEAGYCWFGAEGARGKHATGSGRKSTKKHKALEEDKQPRHISGAQGANDGWLRTPSEGQLPKATGYEAKSSGWKPRVTGTEAKAHRATGTEAERAMGTEAKARRATGTEAERVKGTEASSKSDGHRGREGEGHRGQSSKSDGHRGR